MIDMKRESHRQIWNELSMISSSQQQMLLGKILVEIYTFEEAMDLIKAYQFASSLKGDEPTVDSKLVELGRLQERVDEIHENIKNQRNNE